jgi:hypothetical protein
VYGLYQAGQHAIAAVRLFALPGARWLPRAPEALHVVNPGDVVGLAAENANSAELGLALALLMFGAQTQQAAVIASGALDLRVGRDVKVLPVHHLARKLRLVLNHFSQPGTAPAPRYFIVPAHDPDGIAVADRYRQEIDALGILGIEVHVVSSLGDAVRLLDAKHRAMTRMERGVRGLLAATAVLLLTALVVRSWLIAPIALTFTPVANADGSIVATPARAAIGASSVQLLPPCRAGDLPAFPIGEHMAVHLRSGSTHGLGSWLGGGFRHALVSISGSGLKVLPPPASAAVAPGSDAGYLIEIREPQEETLLVWLAKRGSPFDTSELEERLRGKLQTLRPSERISAARNLLQAAAPGVILYSFRSVPPEACP